MIRVMDIVHVHSAGEVSIVRHASARMIIMGRIVQANASVLWRILICTNTIILSCYFLYFYLIKFFVFK